ncbi:PepSY-associated TM helix domain-containing protein [Flavobacterium sp. DG1-102-2]|uniref:PepSY-associated TM helix domain-containing protein n=1 Tax=Flavobacterium sp. DG1-102-2 TaxID=3081663 RepID=UPI002949EAC5|nr:PepSY-associated TM helix domain-containing protein [Flavobacterium sp. DG1-102-2]MDV6168554.1 PepSY-associated TM helix domain-containing protein [Flavobacterium sp. DG1-102-2]
MILNKKKLFELHGWIGTKLCILFFIICFSGTLATMSSEMDWLFNRDIRATPQATLASKNLIVHNFRKKFPNGAITHWAQNEAPYICNILSKEENGDKSYVFVNQYTGVIQGESTITFQRFFRKLHYNLFMPLQIGHYTVLFFGFLLFISLITALLFYKKWWRKLFELKTDKGSLVFFRSIHRLVGLWSIPFTLLFSITGFWYFLERSNIAGLGDAGNPQAPQIVNNDEKNTQKLSSQILDYDKAIRIAEQQIPNLVAGDIAIPGYETDYIYITGKNDVDLVRQRANKVFVDAKNYKVISYQNANNIPRIVYISDIADPLHFGYWGGLPTKIIWFIAGLGICSLILTGIWIILKRKATQKKNNKKRVFGPWKYINYGITGVMLFYMYSALVKSMAAASVFIYVTFTWLLFIALAYYIFVYRLNKSVSKKQ